MGTNRDGSTGLTAIDVAQLMADMDEMHYGHTVIELRVVTNEWSRRPRLEVVAANYVGTLRTARNTRGITRRAWPSSGHRTIAGCMVACLYELSAVLEELRATSRGGVTPLEAAISSTVTTDNP